ncbi:MAG TPA: PAS domain S-box protein [Candidatus Methanoperedens sp.]
MKNATERKTGHLADHGKLFQVIFEQAAVGVALVSTSSGKFLKINKKYCDIVGYSEEEMLNIDFQSITYPEDRKSDFEIVELLKSGKIREFSKEKRYIRKNGDIVWVNGTVSPMWDQGKQPDYHIKVVQDITERKSAEQKLRESEERFKNIFDNALDGILVADIGTKKLLMGNRMIFEMLGLEKEELKNMSAMDIHPEKDWPYVREQFEKQARKEIELAKELPMKRKDGSVFYADVNSTPITLGGRTYLLGIFRDITERKQAEGKLKDAILEAQNEKNKSEAIISALGDRIIIQDKDYNIVYQNKIQTEIYGEHDGELCYKVYEGRDTICEDCPVERTFRDGKIHRSERAIHIGSGISYFELISSPLRDPEGNIIAGVKIIRDMTEKRQAEEEVRSTKDRLQFLLDSSLAVIYACKAFGDFGATYISENVTKLLGYMSSDFTENPLFWQDRIHPDDKERVISNLESIFESEHQILEYRFLNKDGIYMWMRDELTLIRDENGKPREIAGYWLDITEHKRAEEERMHLMAKEQSARAEAEAAKKLEKLKSIFIASTSHELRTPLNSIIGFTGVLLQGWSGELNKEQKEHLEMINSSSKHLLELIIDILDISKIESGSIDLKVSVFDLRGVVDEAIKSLRVSIKEKGLDISIEMEEISMRSDRTRLLQCIMNLVGNSVKYTEKGSIKISAKITENKVDISVTDTGIGIKTQDIPRLFVPFVRIESPLTLKTSGTGLGLYLTNKLVRDVLGGEIYVISKYGKGSTFTIQIPLEVEKTGRIIKNKVDI